ncbi:MAG: hypothetical protein L3J49_14360, partial [Desulfobulbaceae bacterium]|nr:hypothetical protein [Desulfobulbaceae bacterium]
SKTKSRRKVPKEALLLFLRKFSQGRFSFGTRLADSALSLPGGGLKPVARRGRLARLTILRDQDLACTCES